MAAESDLAFEWDEDKAAANLTKHKISFAEAKTAFADPFALTIADPDHSVAEHRFIAIGASANGKILVVSYTGRGRNIRLISCRKATKAERSIYEERESF